MEIAKFFKKKTQLGWSEIPVKIDNRLWVAILFLAMVTGSGVPPSIFEDPILKFLIGLLTTVLFFGTIFLHELGHFLVALNEDLEVREFNLYPFGGISRFKRPPDKWEAELRIAIAGPATSFLVTVVCGLLYSLANWADFPIVALIFYFLGILNGLVTLFNLFPGFPLDGGRVLRAFLWKSGKEINDATVLTCRAGQAIGIVLIVFGLLIAFFQNNFFIGLWISVIGFFLFAVATSTISETSILEVSKVKDVMSQPLALLPTETVLNFVDNVLPNRRQNSYIVNQDGQFLGILTVEDIKELDKKKWKKTEIKSVMRPVKPEYFVDEDTSFEEAKEIMRQNGVGMVAVIDEAGQLVGSLQRGKYKRKII